MRNFKKFLALVLAMLMVSACAVSVAAFDDIDEDIYYAEAVDLLATLGVIKGRNDGTDNFYPNDTLTREEAAVIAAKLIAGDDAPEWAAQTTEFVDVVDTWSFAYINYAYANGAMIGVGDNKFEPKRNLQIDEALKIALAVADPNALRQATINMNANPTGYWADHFIIAASNVGVTEENREAGLLKDIPVIRNYEAACTRGMFAQIMANAFYFGEGIMAGFDYVSMKATVEVDADKKYVTICDTASDYEIKVTFDFFTEALKAEGYTDITASDLTNGSYINVVALKTAKEIASLEVLTDIDVVKYSDDVVITHVMKDATNVDAAVIEIDGIKYTVGAEDSKGTSGAWGEAATPVRGIELTVIDVANEPTYIDKNEVTKTTVPAYYEAFLYNDDGDNDYERAVIKAYEIATLSKGGEFDHDNDANTAKLNGTIINYVAGTSTTDAYMTLDGAACTAWGNTPKLVRVEGNAILVLETADTTTTGVVSNFSADNKYINIGDKKVTFADKYVAPAKWILGQNVALYTIGGEYVNVVNEDTTTGMKEQTILVDNVTVENGVALIDGYKWNNGTLTAVTDFKVVGLSSNGKLVADDFAALKVVVGEKTYAGLVGNGTPDTAGTNWKSDAQATVVFEDGKSYTFQVTNAGAYYKNEFVKGNLAGITLSGSSSKIEIKNGYLYLENADSQTVEPIMKMADAYSILLKKAAEDAAVVRNDEYAGYSYVTLDSFKYQSAVVRAYDANLDGATRFNTEKPVAFVYATSVTPYTAEDAKQTKLNEGETIVKIYAVENEALSESTYNAIDLFTGEKVNVTGNATVGGYALVKEGKVIEATAAKILWLGDKTLDVIVAFDGSAIKGYNTMIVDPTAENQPNRLENIIPTDGTKATFTNIKYWVADTATDNAYDIKAGDATKIFTDAGTHKFYGCIIDGTVIVLTTPELVVNPT